MNHYEWLHLRNRIQHKPEEKSTNMRINNDKIKGFCAGVIVGAGLCAIGVGISNETAHADPSCGGNGPSIDGSCQWWRNGTGPGTYSPSLGGPSFYQPCIGDAASKASSHCIDGE